MDQLFDLAVTRLHPSPALLQVPLEADISSSVVDVTDRVVRSVRVVHPRGPRTRMLVSISNPGAAAIPGPISLVIPVRSRTILLANRTGVTRAIAPAGCSYINLNVDQLPPGGGVRAVLNFHNPRGLKISRALRVLAGPGPR